VLPLHNSAKWENSHKIVRKSAERVKRVVLSTLYFLWIFISFSGKNNGVGKYLKVFKHRLATFLRILASYLNLITIYISQTSRDGKQKYVKSNIIYFYV
jgi:hypothetical protein